MHPVINQAVAAERDREFRAYAAAAGRARRLRSSAHARPLIRLPRRGHGPARPAGARLLRGPRSA